MAINLLAQAIEATSSLTMLLTTCDISSLALLLLLSIWNYILTNHAADEERAAAHPVHDEDSDETGDEEKGVGENNEPDGRLGRKSRHLEHRAAVVSVGTKQKGRSHVFFFPYGVNDRQGMH